MNRGQQHSPNNPRDHDDLFELVKLEAMGLLEDDEKVELERRFADAPDNVRKALRREQSRVVDALIANLPDTNPAPTLRGRVIESVLRAVGTVSRLSTSATTPAVATTPTPREEIFGTDTSSSNEDRFRIHQARRVNRYWRAAAIGLGFASLAMGYGLFQLQQESSRLADAQRNDALLEMMLDQYGHTFQSALFGPNTKLAQFTPVSDTELGKAVLLVDPVRRTAQLYCADLPELPYELVVIDRDGHPTGTQLRFTPTGNVHSENVAGLTDLHADNRIELLRVDPRGERTPILRGTPLIRADQL